MARVTKRKPAVDFDRKPGYIIWKHPVEGLPMERINLRAFYELGCFLHPITELRNTHTKLDLAIMYRELEVRLRSLLAGDPIKLRNEEPVTELMSAIDSSTEMGDEGFEKWRDAKVDGYYRVNELARNLEAILSNEFPTLHSYMVFEEGLESVDALIQTPEKAFSESTVAALSAYEGYPLVDFRESARCLAFGFFTACGFHAVRSAEAVLRKWHQLVSPKAPFETTWGDCVKAIRDENKEEKDGETKKRVGALLSMLDSFRDVNRNPLMHPELSLGREEALSIFKLVSSFIPSMVLEIARLEEKPIDGGAH